MPVSTWKFVGGRLCLDFVNTVGGRAAGGRSGGREYCDAILHDKLQGYADLLAWAESAGAMTHPQRLQLGRLAADRPREGAAVLSRAIVLRAGLYRIFISGARKWPTPPADWEILERELTTARVHERLAPRSGAFGWQWDESPGLLDRALWPVARSAAELLVSDGLAMVRLCAGENCGWIFLDESRNRKRQWCDMKDCGNRAKVKRFRDRQRG